MKISKELKINGKKIKESFYHFTGQIGTQSVKEWHYQRTEKDKTDGENYFFVKKDLGLSRAKGFDFWVKFTNTDPKTDRPLYWSGWSTGLKKTDFNGIYFGDLIDGHGGKDLVLFIFNQNRTGCLFMKFLNHYPRNPLKFIRDNFYKIKQRLAELTTPRTLI